MSNFLTSQILQATKGHEELFNLICSEASDVWYGPSFEEKIEMQVETSLNSDFDDSYGRVYLLFKSILPDLERENFIEFLKEEMIVSDDLRSLSEEYADFMYLMQKLNILSQILVLTIGKDEVEIEKDNLTKYFTKWLLLLNNTEKMSDLLASAIEMLSEESKNILNSYNQYSSR